MQAESTTNIKLQDQTERPGCKKTKLGWIPEEWSTPTIPEVFQFLRTTSFSRNQMNYDENDGVHCIHYGDIHATYRRPILDFNENSEIPKINNDVELSSNIDLLEDGDLIIADASEDYEGIGTAIELTNLNGKEVLSGLHTFAFRDDKGKTVRGFRSYLFRNPQVKKALKTIATGSKVYGVSKGNLEKFRIVLPTPLEQQKIAKILSTWDTAIAIQEQLITAKETFKKGLMQVLLTGKKRFKKIDETNYPDWTKSKLGNHCNILMCKRIFASQTTETGIIPFYKIGTIGKKADSFISRELFEEYKARFNYPRLGEILITCSGTVGKCLPFDGMDAYYQDSNIVWLDNPLEEIKNSFLYYFLSNFPWNQLNSTTITRIYSSDLKNVCVYFPCKEEQQKIAAVLNNADQEIELLKQQLAQLQDQKRGLMQRLLTGEIRVKI